MNMLTNQFPNSDTDKELIQKVRSGDISAFEKLYRRYAIKMYRQAYAILDDEEEAKDLVQELFTNFWNKISDIELLHETIFPYLYTANKNLVFKKLERDKLKRRHRDFLYAKFEEMDFSTLEQLNYTELKDKLDQAVQTLPPKMKTVFLLSRDQQLSHKEIAAKLEISDKTVKKQINNALKILRKELNLSGLEILIALLLLF